MARKIHELSKEALEVMRKYAVHQRDYLVSWSSILPVWDELTRAGLVRGEKPSNGQWLYPSNGQWLYYRLTPLGKAFLALTRR